MRPSRERLNGYLQKVISANGNLKDVLERFIREFGSQHKHLLAAIILEYLSTRSWLVVSEMVSETYASLNALLRLNVRGEVFEPLVQFSENVRKNPHSKDSLGKLIPEVKEIIKRVGNVISKCSVR